MFLSKFKTSVIIACLGLSSSAFAAHCPAVEGVHLNKLGYYVATEEWRSKEKVPQDMVVLRFYGADADFNTNSMKYELSFCSYELGFRDDSVHVLMILVPRKTYYVNAKSNQWKHSNEFSLTCKYDDPQENKPGNCSFSN